jgi:hypothetical protein
MVFSYSLSQSQPHFASACGEWQVERHPIGAMQKGECDTWRECIVLEEIFEEVGFFL